MLIDPFEKKEEDNAPGHKFFKPEEETDKYGRTQSEKEAFFKERSAEFSYDRMVQSNKIDKKFDFINLTNEERLGWLVNMHPTIVIDPETKKQQAAVDYYFIEEDGGRFRATFTYNPYFYVAVRPGSESEVEYALKKKYAGTIVKTAMYDMEDLDLKNHLVGLKGKYLKLEFANTQDLMMVRKEIFPFIKRNKESYAVNEIYKIEQSRKAGKGDDETKKANVDVMTNLTDIREYDVPYHIRVAIDNSIYVGRWYDVKSHVHSVEFGPRPDLEERPDPIVMAFDIETTKLPLKFPDARIDSVMMISYMIDGQGYLIVNREIVSEDIDDFEYTPKPEYDGPFIVFNEPDEKATLQKFIDHILEIKPHIIVTFNGDFFDWPFVDTRCKEHGISLLDQTGYGPDSQEEYKSRPVIHMDAFRWVKRDSYLPQGSQGLKAVTKAKLGYEPLEISPEDMCRFAVERPQILANYSVSDAVATYYLYMKYVHPFIFSLCSIIPMEPDEVLRKGSGTLCETLLMVEAYHAKIIMPNKQQTPLTRFFEGKFLENETYVGGHVESLESGVFRSDIPVKFNLDVEALDGLQKGARSALKYTLVHEMEIPFEEISNFEEIVKEVEDKIEDLKATPKRLENPLIYHLDVSAMYPNIILTNRLQPSALVNDSTCASCDFNKPDAICQKKMDWMWRGDYSPSSRMEYEQIKTQLDGERFPNPNVYTKEKKPIVNFYELPEAERVRLIKLRLGEYSKKVYRKNKITSVQERKSTICMRENPFYVDTVRAFRDRRYVYKGKLKEWQGKLAKAANNPAELQTVRNMIILYDSLQLAHKCILNSFYGYVMRKGARWFSMEMAGIVCLTGSNIITKAREIVDKIGRPLELDTDGIWCVLPSSFPENVCFKRTSGKKIVVSYPGAMLNEMVAENFTNHQYETLVDKENLIYETRSENSIFFEVDGPYKCMIIPASKEEDRLLKKRYAVFNDDGSIAELKGFELKRRGELQLIKAFQGQMFDKFLEGTNLIECYDAVGGVANQWLDILYTKGRDLQDSEVFDLISENRSMSRELSDYGNQRSTSITAAKRLGEFLGADTVKGKGLACKFIISQKPIGTTVTDRSVPVAIFFAEEKVKRHFLRRWLKSPALTDLNIRSILDWDYYIERLGGTIQKIITIPAALQQVTNPVPRLRHPDWLFKRIAANDASHKQRKMSSFFKKEQKLPRKENVEPKIKEIGDSPMDIEDIEDMGKGRGSGSVIAKMEPKKPAIVHKRPRMARENMPVPMEKRIHAASAKNQTIKQQTSSSKSSGSASAKATSTALSQARSRVNHLYLAYQELYGPPPDKDEDFQAYLNYQKAKWKWQYENRNAEPNLGVSKKGKFEDSNTTSGRIGGFVQSTDIRQKLQRSYWEIVQIRPMNNPGFFKLFAIVDDVMIQATLEIPRIFFVDCSTTDDSGRYNKVTKQLPRSQQSSNLYEFLMSERMYQDILALKELSSFFNKSEVLGVYETNVPLDFRAILSLGTICELGKRIQNSNDIQLELADLHDKKVDHDYMKREKFEYVYICHNGSGDQGLYGVFFSSSQLATIVLVDPRNNRQMPKPGKVYKEMRALLVNQMQDEGEEADILREDMEFDVIYSTSDQNAQRSIQRLVSDYTMELKRPCLALLQFASPIVEKNFAESVPILNDMPHLTLCSNAKDNVYPVFGWETEALKRVLEHSFHQETWLAGQISCAENGRVPVGNLPVDYPLFIADVFFSRQLQRMNFLLWVSPSIRPDIGGLEDEDNLLLSELAEETTFEINHEGCYDTICVEIELDSLTVNSIVHSTHVHNAEGVSDGNSFDTSGSLFLDKHLKDNSAGVRHVRSGYDDSSACVPAFRVLKNMVHSLIKQVAQEGNLLSDAMLSHFYRWLTTQRTLSYDPALHRLIQTLMKKVFLQLVVEFRRLGSKIVYASFNKIIISTTKTSAVDAKAYIDYILEGIRKQDVFSYLVLTPVAYWEQLWWIDNCNLVGIKSTNKELFDEDEDEMDEDGLDEEMEDDNFLESSQSTLREGKFDMRLNITEYLPALLQRPFKLMIREFILDIHAFRVEKRFARINRGELSCTPAAENARRRLEGIETEEISYIKELLQKLSEKMFNCVNEINAKTFEFPVLPGSHLNLRNPAVEFSKYILHILYLNPHISEEVTLMRKSLFKLIKVSEYSKDSSFKNPCLSFTLPEVICKFCNDCRDLDLCRDSRLIQRDWRCPNCYDNYDLEMIEQNLIDHLNKKLISFQLQDLVCAKCSNVKGENMNLCCPCSSTYKTKISINAFEQNLKTFSRIAEYHNFELLDEMVKWNLNLSATA